MCTMPWAIISNYLKAAELTLASTSALPISLGNTDSILLKHTALLSFLNVKDFYST